MLETPPDETSRTSAQKDGGAHRGDASHGAGPGLHQYVATLRRHWLLALLTFVVVLAASIGSLFVIDPVYRAEAEVLIRTEDSRQLFPRTGGTSAGALTRSPAAELIYVQSDAFLERVVEEAGSEAEVEVRGSVGSGALDASALVSSGLLFVAEADDRAEARRAAQTWAETYVTVRHESDVAETTALRDLLEGDLKALQTQQQEILEPVTALDDDVAEETDSVELSRLLNQQLAIQRGLASELEPVAAELRRVSSQISSLDVDLRVMEDPQALAFVSRAAELPEERVNGSLTQSVLVGIVAGLALAGGAVAAAQALRRR